MAYSEFKPTKMERGKTYKTLRDNKLWFCVGHIKQTPVCANWEGEIYKLNCSYRKGALSDTWDNWLEKHKYFWLNIVVFGTIEKFNQSVTKILNTKL